MKLSKLTIFHQLLLIPVVVLFVLSSCSKNENNSNPVVTKTELSLEVGGIVPLEDNFENSPISAANVANNAV